MARPPMRATVPRTSPRPSRGPRARGLTVLALVAAVALVGGAVFVILGGLRGPGPRAAAEAFARGWSRGDDPAAARRTTAPRAAVAGLRANRRGLDGATAHVSVLDVAEHGDTARARLRVAWRGPAVGRFAYDPRASRRGGAAGGQVVGRPAVVHPRLVDGRRLGTTVDAPARADILARDRRPLVTARAVVHVGVARDRVRDVDATARAVAGVVDVDARAYARAIR